MKSIIFGMVIVTLCLSANLKAQTGDQLRNEVYAIDSILSLSDMNTLSRAELSHDLAVIDSLHQFMLDSGIDNAANEDWYNAEMDQLLNTAYRIVMSQQDPQQQQSLKKEQRSWLKKRDNNTKKARREITRANGEGTLTEQVTLGAEADFVHKRVLYLIRKIKI